MTKNYVKLYKSCLLFFIQGPETMGGPERQRGATKKLRERRGERARVRVMPSPMPCRRHARHFLIHGMSQIRSAFPIGRKTFGISYHKNFTFIFIFELTYFSTKINNSDIVFGAAENVNFPVCTSIKPCCSAFSIF